MKLSFRNKTLSVFGIVMILTMVGTTVALAAGLLNLPSDPITVTHGPWTGNLPYSTLTITLSNVPAGFDVMDGTYDGWCVEDNGQANAPETGVTISEPSGGFWGSINWLINNRGGYNGWDVQVAIWMLTGTNNSVITTAAQALYDAASANAGFVPGPGQLVAVRIIDDNAAGDMYQDTIIEVPIPDEPPPPSGPGTGTPGYWMNHPDAWPVENITIGGITYTKDDAIAYMKAPVKKDKTFTMFPALVSAILNVEIGNESACIADTIAAADAWMAANPIGSCVKGSSSAWKAGEPLYWMLDDYNNGLLCAPHRD
jgi:hypothetical protein